MSIVGDIILGILGGGSLVTLIIFLIKRHDSQKEYSKRMDRLERDVIRNQMLLLMAHYSEADVAELLTCAEYYFVKLKGDWYLTNMFARFCHSHNVEIPQWFKE